MALELKKIFSILKIELSVLNKGKTYVLVLRFFEEYSMPFGSLLDSTSESDSKSNELNMSITVLFSLTSIKFRCL